MFLKTLPLLIVVLAAGCFAPSPVVRLTPRGSDVVWVSGRAVVARERPDHRVAVAFDHQAGNAAAIRLEVVNTSDRRMEVDPSRVTYATCVQESVCRAKSPVVDPEKELIDIDQSQSQERAHQANEASWGLALVLLETTAAVASTAGGKPGQASQHLRNAADDSARSRTEIAASEHRVDRLEAQKHRWSIEALRRTTLGPGQGVAGFVYVPIDSSASIVWLGVQVSGEPVWFTFDQKVMRPSWQTEGDDLPHQRRRDTY